MAAALPVRAIAAVLFASAAIAASPYAARAQDTALPDSRFPRLRIAGSWEGVNAYTIPWAGAGSSVSASYDLLRLSHLPGGSGDPAALSIYLESTGDNPLHETYGSQLFGAVSVRTPARPVYVVFAAGVSHDNDYDDTLYFDGHYEVAYRIYPPATRLGFRLFFGLDVPKTPVFLELGGGIDSGHEGGSSLQIGVRL